MPNRLVGKLKNLKKILIKKKLKIFIPLTYLRIVIFGLVLTGLFVIFPNLFLCPFGQDYCMPAGILIIFAVSFPGYFLVSAISTRVILSEFIMLIILILFSTIFYFILGSIIDNQRGKRQTPASFVKLIIFIAFLVLIILLLLFI